VDQAWVSRSLRALEASKLVERRRDPQDSRLVLFALTQRGRQVLDEFRPYAAWSQKVLLNGVDETRLKVLLDQLEGNTQRLIDTLEYMPEPPAKDKCAEEAAVTVGTLPAHLFRKRFAPRFQWSAAD
jgi:DNA-binding PadR family transcriptional regulator